MLWAFLAVAIVASGLMAWGRDDGDDVGRRLRRVRVGAAGRKR